MPTFPVPKVPEAIDPKQSSVFDPLYQSLARKAVDLSGLTDPTSGVMQSALPTPLIAKIPFDKIAGRNEQLLQLLKDRGVSQELQDAVGFAAKKYPRVLGHVQSVFEVPPTKEAQTALGPRTLGASGEYSKHSPLNLSEILTNPTGLMKYPHHSGETLAEGTAETFGHELTHAAQRLWNGNNNFRTMYDNSVKWGGKPTYGDSVFEVGARNAGQNFKAKMMADVTQAGSIITSKPSIVDRIMEMFDISKVDGPKSVGKPQVMQLGDKLLQRMQTGEWKILTPDEQSFAINKLKDSGVPQTVAHPEEIPLIKPPTTGAKPVPKLSGKWNQPAARASSLSKSSLNQSMVIDIRNRAAKGVASDALAEEFGVKPDVIRNIVKGDSWNWVK